MSNPNKPWKKSPTEIVDEKNDEIELVWGTDQTSNLLAEFIEDHCRQEDFEKFVKEQADIELELISARID